MVVSSAGTRVPAAVVWHDLECGGYTIDLELWLELAERVRGPVLDIGAGTGRVTLALARAGHRVTALEREQVLLDALSARAVGLGVECVCEDARAFSLPRRDYGLCVVPMHTVHLLGRRAQRAQFLVRARGHLREGGLLALALLSDAEPFDCDLGHAGPTPESVCVEDARFESAPTRVAVGERTIVIERERSVRPFARTRRSRAPSHEHDRVELARVSAAQMRSELRAVGFVPAATRQVPATDEHVGSDVVIAHA